MRKIRRWLTAAQRPQRRMERGREMAKAKVSGRCVRCVAVRNYQKVAHSGTASTAQKGEGAGGGESESLQTLCSLCRCEKNKKLAHSGTAITAQNEEGREAAKAKASGRCVRCVAVRKIRKWLTAAQRPRRRMESGREMAKASGRCVRCVAVRKIGSWLTAAQRPRRRMKRRGRRRKQKYPNAVFVVSL